MPTTYFDITPSNSITDMGTYGYTACLPVIRDCRQTCELIVKDCEQLNNCNKCKSESDYCIWWADGQTFDIQLRVLDQYNPDETMPVDGWGTFIIVELCDKDGNVISTDHTLFADEYVVGWNGENSYQTIRINMDNAANLVGADCFNLKFTAYRDTGGTTDVYCSEPFAKANSCDSLVCLEGVNTKSDCCGNFYGTAELAENWVGTSNFSYSNQVCLQATLLEEEGDVTVTEFGSRRSSVTVRDVKTIRLAEKIPSYMHQYLRDIVMSAENILVNGVEYQSDGFNPENAINSTYFIYDFEVYNECSNDFFCN